MRKRQAILSLCFALIAIILVSCGGANESTPPPSYSREQLQQIERSVKPVREARKRITEVESYLKDKQWSDAFSVLHGPLGGLRRDMSYVTRNLLPEDQKEARKYAKKLFQDIERIDAAIEDEGYSRALENYSRALDDFDGYLSLVPETRETS